MNVKMDRKDSQESWSAVKLEFFRQIKLPKDTPEKPSKRTNFYLKKFDLFQNGETKLGWNWPAFLFGGVWGTYRKIYVLLCIEISFIMAANFFECIMRLSHLAQETRDLWEIYFCTVFLLAGIIYRVFLGLKANLFYIRKTLQKIEKQSPPKRPFIIEAIAASFALSFVDKGLEKLLSLIP